MLRFVPQANLTVLDPIITTAAVTINHGWMVWDTLFGVNAAQQAKPQMAEGYTVSDDGRTYLIKLREGLKWHDGEPVRAQDCAASLARWAVRDTFGQTVAKAVDTWGVADDRTVKITLKRPFPLLIDAIAVQNSFMMPERLAKTDPFKAITEVIGSGPFRFLKDEFVAGSSAAWEKFDGYVPRQEPAEWTSGGKVAHFQRIEWKIIPDAATASAALQNGEVDWYEQAQADLVPLLRRNADIVIAPSNPQGYIGGMRFNSSASAIQRCSAAPRGAGRGEPGRLHARDHGRRPLGVAHVPVAVSLRHDLWRRGRPARAEGRSGQPRRR